MKLRIKYLGLLFIIFAVGCLTYSAVEIRSHNPEITGGSVTLSFWMGIIASPALIFDRFREYRITNWGIACMLASVISLTLVATDPFRVGLSIMASINHVWLAAVMIGTFIMALAGMLVTRIYSSELPPSQWTLKTLLLSFWSDLRNFAMHDSDITATVAASLRKAKD